MRRADLDSGFFICWILNMAFNWEIGAVALALWAVHLWFGLSWYPAAVVAGIWVVGTFFVTGIFAWLSGGHHEYKPNSELKNVNPYSTTTEEIMKHTPAGKKTEE